MGSILVNTILRLFMAVQAKAKKLKITCVA